MADQENLIDQFVSITGIDRDRARFHLESSAWDINVATASFYDDDGDEFEDAQDPSAPTGQMSVEGSRFGSIGIRPPEDSDSDGEGQEFYAGGSESSGQAIIGPPKKKGDIVENLFQSAKDHGAETVDRSEESKTKKNKPAFVGTGYKLGDTGDTPSERIQGASVSRGPRQVDVVLKLWKNGFSVDDGALRDYKDPANNEFLAAISKGEVPRELITRARGTEVNLNMEDKRNEDYVKPKVQVRAFSGEGHTLGSPCPNVVVDASSKASNASSQNSAQQEISVNESSPTTSLQIRLADGSRLVAKFNHSHTVHDIRRYISTARPEYASTPFILLTTFPNKELTDETQTLEDGKLLNAVIVQRMK